MNKRRNLFALLILYIVIVVGAAMFHANNFRMYSDSDGAAEVNYMEFLFFTSVLFQGVMYFVLRSINWKLAILSTILNLLVSIMLTIAIVDWGEYSESVPSLVTIYTWCYMMIFSVVAWLQVKTAWI